MLEALRAVEALQEVGQSGLQWLIDNGEVVLFKKDEEIFKTGRRMRDLEFLEEAAIRQSNRHAVTARTDINPNTKFQ